jgi:hypothetical protein
MIEHLVDCLEVLPDPRDPCKVEHRLVDVLAIAVCAVIGEAESFEDIADYGRCKEGWLKRFLALPNGIPSHDTFRRVLMLVDPDAFERSFLGSGPTHEISGISARGAVSEEAAQEQPRATHRRLAIWPPPLLSR